MEFERHKRISQHWNIAPLIDIVFLLLIFFMLTANFIIQPGIKITLPMAKISHPQQENIAIFISKDSKIYIHEKQLNIDILKDVLKLKLEQVHKKTVVIKADKRIDLGLAVKVMDIAKDAGAEALIISTKKGVRNAKR